VSVLSPRGTARERFLALRSTSAASSAPPPDGPFADEDEDLAPPYLGWEIARCARGLAVDEARAVEAIAAACVASLQAGSTRMPIDDARLAVAFAKLEASDVLGVARTMLDRVERGEGGPLAQVVGRPGDRKPLTIEGPWISTEKMRAVEERFCVRVRDRVARGAVVDERAVRKSIQSVAAGPPPLSDEQKSALRAALSAGFALVTGGPGTGKTTIVVALLRALHWAGVPMDSVAVAAPTGKAAHRLEQAIGAGLAKAPRDLAEAGLASSAPAPQTLHRLLGWSPARGRFARHENDPLSHAVVIVDEASMIDLLMMDRLLRALRDDARLVLLGDADQLPSVEAGAVFRDLCAGLGAARLTKNLRVATEPAARRIVDTATAVNAGTTGARFASAVVTSRPDDVAFEGVEHVDGSFADVGDAFLDRWWSARVASTPEFERRSSRVYVERDGVLGDADRADLVALLDGHARARILCATRIQGLPACADAINERLLARLAPSGAARGARRGHRLVTGTPVLVQRNDYERRLYNGDQGVVVRMDRGRPHPDLVAVFARSGGLDVWPVDDVPDLAAAFAMTVHKAQGSEFDHVALVLPDADLPLLTRELVYTAITRARRSVAIVGPMGLLARSVARVVERHSGVADRLLSR
jgi:exodeoxyribonuclease V alpha subunit